jgi:hypothetical protein
MVTTTRTVICVEFDSRLLDREIQGILIKFKIERQWNRNKDHNQIIKHIVLYDFSGS